MDAGQRNQGDGKGGATTDDAGESAIRKAAGGEGKLSQGEERSALDYLLGTPEPASYKVTVQYETPAGLKDLEFHFRAMDGGKIDKIEQSHISDRTGVMDKIGADMELVMEATTAIFDPETERKVAPRSEEFRTLKPDEPPLASGVDALRARFGTQVGLIAGVASAIREAAGWNRERVGKASRLLVEAAGN